MKMATLFALICTMLSLLNQGYFILGPHFFFLWGGAQLPRTLHDQHHIRRRDLPLSGQPC
jgi:hypothetical protein